MGLNFHFFTLNQVNILFFLFSVHRVKYYLCIGNSLLVGKAFAKFCAQKHVIYSKYISWGAVLILNKLEIKGNCWCHNDH